MPKPKSAPRARTLLLPLHLVLLFVAAWPACAAEAGGATVIPRPTALERDVQFWIRVYTEVTTNEGLLHDESNLGVVYETLRFAANATPRERGAEVDAAKDRYAALLRRLAARAPGTEPTPDERRVLELWGTDASAERLEQASQGIRFQLGQADRFRAGLVRSGAWEAHIADTLANLGLPPEIAALPHVESSFNPAAYSKVGAAGLWQFMRSTGRRYLRIDSVVDERLDPFRSTEAAAQLLAYNYRLLGSWPLAITAYNHGAAGMRRARDTIGSDDIAVIARNYHGPAFGFASRNFYVSFLAALEIERNPEKYFGPIERVPEQRFREVASPAYVPVASLERVLKVDRPTLRALNPALQSPIWEGQRLVPRGYKLRLPAQGNDWTTEKLAARLPPGDQYVAQIESRSLRIRRGDTLPALAQHYGLSARALAELNGMSVDTVLRPGRMLRLPERRPALVASAALLANAVPAATTPPAAAAAVTAAASTAAAPAGAASAAVEDSSESGGPNGGIYVVRRGEALSDIARSLHLSAADLIRYNHLRDADFVFEGQKLRTTADPAGPEADEAALAAAVSPVTVEIGSTVPGSMLARAPDKFAAPGDAGSILRAAADLGGGGAATLFPVGSNTGERPRIVSFEGLPDPGKAEPVSRSQAEALGPSLVPGGGATPQVTDVVDYSVAADGSVHVAAAETIGHYAEWLGVSAARLRTLNHLGSGRSLLVGQKLRLDFSRAKLEQFEQRRRDYHARLQSEFFDAHRIEGTEIYVARRGDSLWTVTQRYPRLPAWLLEEYNPDTDFGELRPGTQLVVPKVEDVATAN